MLCSNSQHAPALGWSGGPGGRGGSIDRGPLLLDLMKHDGASGENLSALVENTGWLTSL